MGHTKCVQNVMLVSQNAQLNCLASVLRDKGIVRSASTDNRGRYFSCLVIRGCYFVIVHVSFITYLPTSPLRLAAKSYGHHILL